MSMPIANLQGLAAWGEIFNIEVSKATTIAFDPHSTEDELFQWQQDFQKLSDDMTAMAKTALGQSHLIKQRRAAKALHRGITNLSLDISSVIFEEIARSDARAAITLSHVCRSWRRVALAVPRLWNRIDLGGSVDLAEAQVQRSKNVPLELSINIQRRGKPLVSGSPPVVSPIFDIVGAASDRWRYFVWITPNVVPEVASVLSTYSVPRLEVLVISAVSDIPFASMPSLRSFITLSGTLGDKVIPMTLTRLTCTIHWRDLQRLEACTHLRKLEIHLEDADRTFSLSFNQPILAHLPSLEELTVLHSPSMLVLVEMPKLTALDVRIKEDLVLADLSGVLFPNLRSLSLVATPRGANDQTPTPMVRRIEAPLNLTPNLTTFSLIGLDGTDENIEILLMHNVNSRRSFFVPHLSTVKFQKCDLDGHHAKWLVDARSLHLKLVKCPNIPTEIKHSLEPKTLSLSIEPFWTEEPGPNLPSQHLAHMDADLVLMTSWNLVDGT